MKVWQFMTIAYHEVKIYRKSELLYHGTMSAIPEKLYNETIDNVTPHNYVFIINLEVV